MYCYDDRLLLSCCIRVQPLVCSHGQVSEIQDSEVAHQGRNSKCQAAKMDNTCQATLSVCSSEHQLHTPFVVFPWKQHLHVTALQSALLVTLDEVLACHNTPNLWYIILFRSGIGRKWNICNSQSASLAPSTKISKKLRIPRIDEREREREILHASARQQVRALHNVIHL